MSELIGETLDPQGSEVIAAPTATEAVSVETAVRRGTIVFIESLRALAVLLVVWDHLVGEWLEESGRSWKPLAYVDEYFTKPFAVIQEFGWLGVAIFFLISGFIISHVSMDETGLQYSLRRFFRIYPPLLLAVLLVYGCLWYENQFHVVGTHVAYPSLVHGLLAVSLVNYVLVPQVIVVGVAWTLVIEMIFYLSMLTVLPLRRRHAALGTWAMLLGVGVVVNFAKSDGPSFFLFAVNVSYLPLLLLGQALWLRWSRRIGTTHFVIISLVAWGLFVHGLEIIQPNFLTAANSYGVSIGFAYAIFLIALLMNDRMHRHAVPRWIASRSYSIYLVHGIIGLTALAALRGHAPYTVGLVVALALSAAFSELMHRLVERPSQQLARRLAPSTPPAPPMAVSAAASESGRTSTADMPPGREVSPSLE